ncbi:ATP-binding protein [Sphaerisporangium sp. TRM90804]|uniref:ATP-binding protein n=1 Tax=Sphaerisporangium sp. TRM90804 TaxID=3031113 RepID=UPI00244888C3|nr:ATP-binding protein [Sphaerisporangium sp. TRM90804]MDH2428659.1 ATP-binding protein [Sphaerisporangium sp. TRM90804]
MRPRAVALVVGRLSRLVRGRWAGTDAQAVGPAWLLTTTGDPLEPPTFSQPFAAVPSQVRAARAFVTALLGADHPCHDDAILLTSELAGNVVRHAVNHEFAVSVALVPGGVRITVGDRGSATFPCVREADDDALSGRGLAMVDKIATRWGFQRTTGNTSVWFHLAQPAPTRA